MRDATIQNDTATMYRSLFHIMLKQISEADSISYTLSVVPIDGAACGRLN